MFHKLIKGIAPVAAFAFGSMVAGCDRMSIQIGEGDGVPLSELDMTGAAPTSLVLAAPDSVVITDGDTLTIDVEGDTEAVDALRFSLDEDTLGIMRKGEWGRNDGKATVRVTMPSPRELMLAGSGTIAAQSMASEAEVNVAGSGRVDVASLAAERLDVNVMGSGSFGAAGSATRLELNIAGSGDAELDELTVDRAEINIAGSGSGAFASDGRVEANIMGSGDVTVFGRATCEVNSMGSGTLSCKPADGGEATASRDEDGEGSF